MARVLAYCLFVTLMVACHSSAPVVSPYPDADAACAVDQRITEARLIRTEDGSPLSIPCGDAGTE